ncbi:MAG: exodeoxyribonuclease VII large subunit [Firmicutes bacterium]|nr:exodeoxyribonuclease VII large subunit [Bacillota bacterium]
MRTLTVSELTSHIKDRIENDHVLANLWVQGEISNFKAAASGHLYLTLKDRNSCVKVVMFRSRARFLNFLPEDGMSVVIRGYISVYEPSGQYQLYAQGIEPSGTGALYVAFEQLKKKLHQEGLFDDQVKKELPKYPRRIALITSPTGAAIRDMIGILRRRWPSLQIILVPVKVQGNDAPGQISSAIELVNSFREVDLAIVGRGGGSLEELWAFNTETVARAIFSSRIPIISAVGHETDYTIADLVADLRAPTPSAAAELAVPDGLDTRRYIQNICSRLTRIMVETIREQRQRVEISARSPVMLRPVDSLTSRRHQVVDHLQKQLLNTVSQSISRDRSRLSEQAGRLQALSPLATLARGFSICTSEKGEIIHSSKQAGKGQHVNIYLNDGSLDCEVKNRYPANN